MTEPREILQTAIRLIDGDRAKSHGPYLENHENIAKLWSAYLGVEITARHAAMMLVLLKVARTMTGEHNRDDYADAAGYLALAWAIAERG